MKRFLQLATLAIFLAPTAALAHVGVGSTSGFAHGFMHPLSGLDHQLAMILVGLFAYQLGGRALWLVPLTFVSVMALGGFLGVMGVPIPFVEVGIALSVVVLGAIVAIGVRAPLAVALGAVGRFAIVGQKEYCYVSSPRYPSRKSERPALSRRPVRLSR